MQRPLAIVAQRLGSLSAVRQVNKEHLGETPLSEQLRRQLRHVVGRGNHEHLRLRFLQPKQELAKHAFANVRLVRTGRERFFNLVDPQHAGGDVADVVKRLLHALLCFADILGVHRPHIEAQQGQLPARRDHLRRKRLAATGDADEQHALRRGEPVFGKRVAGGEENLALAVEPTFQGVQTRDLKARLACDRIDVGHRRKEHFLLRSDGEHVGGSELALGHERGFQQIKHLSLGQAAHERCHALAITLGPGYLRCVARAEIVNQGAAFAMIGQVKMQAQPKARQALPHGLSRNGDDGIARFLRQINGGKQLARIGAVGIDLVRVAQDEHAVLRLLEQVVHIGQRIGMHIDRHPAVGAEVDDLTRIGIQKHVERAFLGKLTHDAHRAVTLGGLHGNKRNASGNIVTQGLFRLGEVHRVVQRLSFKQCR